MKVINERQGQYLNQELQELPIQQSHLDKFMDTFYSEIKVNAKVRGYIPQDVIKSNDPEENKWFTEIQKNTDMQ